MNLQPRVFNKEIWPFVALITVISFFTYFYNYWSPDGLFWDENYHIVAAQKYLHHIFFMEPHPPLGKLLIALGEFLIDADPKDGYYLDVEIIKGSLPEGFSTLGYRFFPALLAWLTAPLVFLLIYVFSSSTAIAALIALCYCFENSLIVHSRGAMLEGSQLFFVIAALLVLALIERRQQLGEKLGRLPFWAGALFGACVATKVTGLILALAFLPLFFNLRKDLRACLKIAFQMATAFIALQYLVWQAHFAIGTTVHTKLQGDGFYRASEDFRKIVRENQQWNPLNFPLMYQESLSYFRHYETGVSQLNICKSDENGSYPLFWPLGARSIRYRWDAENDFTRYRLLQVNPLSWFIGLSGVLVTFGILFFRIFISRENIERNFIWIVAYALMWIGYMSVMLSVHRAMYLYHYFVPFLFSLVLLALSAPYLKLPTKRLQSELFSRELCFAASICVFLVFLIYAPFTYGWPLTVNQLKARSLLSLWDLRCADCEPTNNFARPLEGVDKAKFKELWLAQVSANDGYQEWGIPRTGKDLQEDKIFVKGKLYESGFAVHARSFLKYTLPESRYTELRGMVAFPDYLLTKVNAKPSMVFEIWLDSALIWRSDLINLNKQVQEFRVPVVGGTRLELRVEDGGDFIDNDHGLWLNLSLK